jgi:hypothetical protein
MKFYRVKQISENEFIPQVKFWFLGYWYGIDKDNDDEVFGRWYLLEFQKRWCAKATLEEAKERIDRYRKNNKVKYPKYHKL